MNPVKNSKSEEVDPRLAPLLEKYGEGNVFEITFPDGKRCFLKKPSREVIGMAMTKSRSNALALGEVVLESCWLDGDKEVKDPITNSGYVIGLMEQTDVLFNSKTAEVKKH